MEVTLFNYAGANDLRTLTDESGDPWFVAKDVCDVLEIKTPANAVRYLDDDEKQTVDVPMSTGHRKATIINESGLYSLILRSRKPEAKAFKKWITSEVLPSIRKKGGYMVAKADDTPAEIMARAVLLAHRRQCRPRRMVPQGGGELLYCVIINPAKTSVKRLGFLKVNVC